MEDVVYPALKQDAANSGAEIHSDWADPNAELRPEDPFHEDGPTGETLLESVKELGPLAISRMVNTRILNGTSETPYIVIRFMISYRAWFRGLRRSHHRFTYSRCH